MANKFSVLVPVFNEEARIKPLIKQILKQDLPKNYKLSSILVIASGCTDKTVPIVKKLSKKFEKVQLKVRKERKGKVSAINHGLDLIETETVIMLSGDLLIEKTTFKNLLKKLKREVRAVTGHPTPYNNEKGFVPRFKQFMWSLHHYISKIDPKAGEIIAFKNNRQTKISPIPEKVIADEEYIAARIKDQNYKLKYSPKAKVFNFGPSEISKLYKQRKRVYIGHLDLLNNLGYHSPSNKLQNTLKSIFKYGKEEKIDPLLPLFILFELLTRIDGYVSYNMFNERPYIWDKKD